jgi:putative transcriptional regulator
MAPPAAPDDDGRVSDSLLGRLLIASPALQDPNFRRALVLICKHDNEGAFGLVLNRPLNFPVDQVLADWNAPLAEPARLFNGGPVGVTSAFALGYGRTVQAGDWWASVLPGLGVVDLEHIGDALDAGVEYLRVFGGYAGWGAGQLEAEIAEESWFVVRPTTDDIFTAAPDLAWREVLRKQPGQLAMFAYFPSDPSLN